MLGEHQGLTTRVPHRAPSSSASGPTQSSTESRLDLPVPQAVDDRIAHGRGHRVDDRQHLVQVHGSDAQHHDYRQCYCVIHFKVAERLDLKCSHHIKEVIITWHERGVS